MFYTAIGFRGSVREKGKLPKGQKFKAASGSV